MDFTHAISDPCAMGCVCVSAGEMQHVASILAIHARMARQPAQFCKKCVKHTVQGSRSAGFIAMVRCICMLCIVVTGTPRLWPSPTWVQPHTRSMSALLGCCVRTSHAYGRGGSCCTDCADPGTVSAIECVQSDFMLTVGFVCGCMFVCLSL